MVCWASASFLPGFSSMSQLLERNVGTLAEDVISAETQHPIPGQHPESDGPALSIPVCQVFPTSLGHAVTPLWLHGPHLYWENHTPYLSSS